MCNITLVFKAITNLVIDIAITFLKIVGGRVERKRNIVPQTVNERNKNIKMEYTDLFC